MNGLKERLLVDIRSIRQELATAMSSTRRWHAANRALARVEKAMSRPLRLAIFGEPNTGKSSLINLLMKQPIVPAGSFAGQETYLRVYYADETVLNAISNDGTRNRLTTKAFAQIAQFEPVAATASMSIYGARDNEDAQPSCAPVIDLGFSGAVPGTQNQRGKFIELGAPQALLRHVEIVEARGFPEEQLTPALARTFQPVDVTVWCTLATQAWKATEQAAWERIPASRRNRAMMLVTYRDALRNPKDEARLLARLQGDVVPAFSEVVMVSFRDAAAVADATDAAMAERMRVRSNAEAADAAVRAALAEQQRERFRRAGRALNRIAALLRLADEGRRSGAGHGLAARLEWTAACAIAGKA